MTKLKAYNLDELRDLYDKNKEFAQAVYERVYEEAMEWQAEEFKLCGAEAFNYHDHYSSFYLTTPIPNGVKDGKSLRGELDEDYMTEEMKPLYKKLCENAEKMDWLEYQCDEYCKLDEECDELADKLAELYTNMLRTWETITDEQIWEELGRIADGEHYMSEWETDGTKVYEHITKEYK